MKRYTYLFFLLHLHFITQINRGLVETLVKKMASFFPQKKNTLIKYKELAGTSSAKQQYHGNQTFFYSFL
jgi:hypothetical protein